MRKQYNIRNLLLKLIVAVSMMITGHTALSTLAGAAGDAYVGPYDSATTTANWSTSAYAAAQAIVDNHNSLLASEKIRYDGMDGSATAQLSATESIKAYNSVQHSENMGSWGPTFTDSTLNLGAVEAFYDHNDGTLIYNDDNGIQGTRKDTGASINLSGDSIIPFVATLTASSTGSGDVTADMDCTDNNSGIRYQENATSVTETFLGGSAANGISRYGSNVTCNLFVNFNADMTADIEEIKGSTLTLSLDVVAGDP